MTTSGGVLEQGAEELFVPKKDEVARDWRKLNDKEIHNLFSSTNKRMIKSRMREAACMLHNRNAYKIIGKPEGKKQTIYNTQV